MTRTIVVGVDGSAGSVLALGWALAAASQEDCVVEVVTAWPHTGPVFVREVPGHHSNARERARSAQAGAVREALAAMPEHVRDEVPVTAVLENDRPEHALALRARHGHLLVLGATGRESPRARAELADRYRELLVDCPIAVVSPDTGRAELFEPLARTGR